jgi:maltose alpha-D-glucosyltransferase/alpha-amylase
MQWSSEQNAGFSTARPEQLYSPVVTDPVYSYQAVNVAAQQADPASQLHWMRNLVGLRKLFRVFGRGSLELLEPENRKIVAHVRQYQQDLILCVVNLSHLAQPVLLDLSAFKGMTPVEMLGYTKFPEIGADPYLLTLGAYGYYWFELQRRDA